MPNLSVTRFLKAIANAPTDLSRRAHPLATAKMSSARGFIEAQVLSAEHTIPLATVIWQPSPKRRKIELMRRQYKPMREVHNPLYEKTRKYNSGFDTIYSPLY